MSETFNHRDALMFMAKLSPALVQVSTDSSIQDKQVAKVIKNLGTSLLSNKLQSFELSLSQGWAGLTVSIGKETTNITATEENHDTLFLSVRSNSGKVGFSTDLKNGIYQISDFPKLISVRDVTTIDTSMKTIYELTKEVIVRATDAKLHHKERLNSKKS